MAKNSLNLFLLICVLVSCTFKRNQNDTLQIITLMNQSANDWNVGDLDRFMALYDTASTFMLSDGPVGLKGMRDNYQKTFFIGNKPKQNLKYEDMLVRLLGDDHALLTGKFVLYGNGLSERRGIYTLIFVRRRNGWKMLHDHSS